MKTGIELITEERSRQVSVKGWTSEHDKQHNNNELAEMAALYAIPDYRRYVTINHFQLTLFKALYPNKWDIRWWKPSAKNRVRELVKAGALIAAEIDRIQNI